MSVNCVTIEFAKSTILEKPDLEQALKKPSLPIAALIGLAGAASVLVTPGLFLAPGLFGYLLLAGGAMPYCIALAVCAGGAFLLAGPAGLAVLGALVPVSVCLFVMLRCGMGYFDSALAASALSAVYYYLVYALPDLLAGDPAFTGVQDILNSFLSIMQEQMALLPGGDTPEIAQMTASLRVFTRMLPTLMPGLICLLSAMSGLFNLLICYRQGRRAGVPLRKMSPFALWQLPKSFGTGALIMIAGAIVASLLQFSGIQAVVFAVAMVAGAPFAVQGICLIWFVINLRGRNRLMLALFVLMMVFAISTFMITMAFVGAFEQLLHMRQKYLARDTRGDQ